MKTRFFTWLGAMLAAGWISATLSSCTLGPRYQAPRVKVEPGFAELPQTYGSNATPSRATSVPPAGDWWRAFHDPELDRLIADALRANDTLRIAAARIREARFQRSITAGDLLPTVDADGGYLLARGSKNVVLDLGSSGGGSTSSGGSSTPKKEQAQPGAAAGSQAQTANPLTDELTPLGKGGLPGVTTSLYQIGFDATWELDVFGGNRKRLEAATASLTAAVESFRDMKVTLLAEVARDYLELRGAQQRLEVARKNLADQNESLQLTLSLVRSGLQTQIDVNRARAEISTTAASIPPLETEIRREIHALSTLLSRPPTALASELEAVKVLPAAPPQVPVGLPSQLLKRRPDIRRAEREIAAANALIGAARADLFPQFGLTGSVGLDSSSAGNLFDAGSRYFLISPTVAWRVFDAGKIVSNIALQRAAKEESVLQYRLTILTALQEVEDALVAYGAEQTRRAELSNAVKQNEETLHLARDRYQHGLATFLDVLDAERSVLAAQDSLVQSEQSVATDIVALYKALGGGWE